MPVSMQDFVAQVFQTIHDFGGLTMVGKIAGVILLVIASMKVSPLASLWDKLGAFKAWAGPILGLAYGIVSLSLEGHSINLASVFAYLSAGAGAVVLHELLDTVKAIPGIGGLYVTVIDLIEGALNKS